MSGLLLLSVLLAQSGCGSEAPFVGSARDLAVSIVEATGQKITLDAELGDEIVWARSGSTDVVERLRTLAIALHADLDMKEGNVTLARTRATKLQMEEAHNARFASAVKKLIEARIQESASDPNSYVVAQGFRASLLAFAERSARISTGASATLSEMGVVLPAEEMLLRLLSDAPASMFASLTKLRPTVFSDAPTQVQTKLSFNSTGAKRLFTSQVIAISNVLTNEPPDDPDLRPLWIDAIRLMMGASEAVRFRLVLFRDLRGMGASLYVFGLNHQLVGRSAIFLTVPRSMLAPPFEAHHGIRLPDVDVAVSASLRDLVRFTQGVMPRNLPDTGRALNAPELLQVFTRSPLTSEPVEWCFSQSLENLSDSSKKDVVAVISDEAIEAIWPRMMGKTIAQREVTEALAETGHEMIESPSAIVVRPIDPLRSEAERLKRGATNKFVGAVTRQGHVRLRDQSEWVFATGGATRLPLAGLVEFALSKSGFRLLPEHRLTWHMTRALGSLSESQWRSAQSELDASALSQFQRDAFSDVSYLYRSVTKSEDPRLAVSGLVLGESLPLDEVSPFAVIPGCKLTVVTLQEPALIPYAEDNRPQHPLDFLAIRTMLAEARQVSATASADDVFVGRYVISSSNVLRVIVRTGRITLEDVMVEPVPPSNGQVPAPYRDLPQAFKDAIEKVMFSTP